MHKRNRKGKAALTLIMKARGWNDAHISSWFLFRELHIMSVSKPFPVIHPSYARGMTPHFVPADSLPYFPSERGMTHHFVHADPFPYIFPVSKEGHDLSHIKISKERPRSGTLQCYFDTEAVKTFFQGFAEEQAELDTTPDPSVKDYRSVLPEHCGESDEQAKS